MKNYENVERWNTLTEEAKKDYFKKVEILFSFLRQNRGKHISWNMVNDILHLKHLYRFSIDDADEDIRFDENFVWMEE